MLLLLLEVVVLYLLFSFLWTVSEMAVDVVDTAAADVTLVVATPLFKEDTVWLVDELNAKLRAGAAASPLDELLFEDESFWREPRTNM